MHILLSVKCLPSFFLIELSFFCFYILIEMWTNQSNSQNSRIMTAFVFASQHFKTVKRVKKSPFMTAQTRQGEKFGP